MREILKGSRRLFGGVGELMGYCLFVGEMRERESKKNYSPCVRSSSKKGHYQYWSIGIKSFIIKKGLATTNIYVCQCGVRQLIKFLYF